MPSSLMVIDAYSTPQFLSCTGLYR